LCRLACSGLLAEQPADPRSQRHLPWCRHDVPARTAVRQPPAHHRRPRHLVRRTQLAVLAAGVPDALQARLSRSGLERSRRDDAAAPVPARAAASWRPPLGRSRRAAGRTGPCPRSRPPCKARGTPWGARPQSTTAARRDRCFPIAGARQRA
jgi:hypothetical protein